MGFFIYNNFIQNIFKIKTMDESAKYGQMDFSLPHDVIKLPSQGIFYKPKKETIKVGFLTAQDENILMSQNNDKEGIIYSLLRQKIYEPGFNINDMLDCDVQAVLIFLRNTSFGPEYNFTVTDPRTNKTFETTVLLDELDYKPIEEKPDFEGLFSYVLPKSKKEVKFRLMTIGDQKELDKFNSQYPAGMTVPIATKRLEKQIVEIDGTKDPLQIVKFINQMPISDAKDFRRFAYKCEPKIDLQKVIQTPSGEKVTIDVTFGVEFFRPFF
jgi:hypothetical protein